jgi:hypothetical protein
MRVPGPETDELVMDYDGVRAPLCALRAPRPAKPNFWEFVTYSALFVVLSVTTLNPSRVAKERAGRSVMPVCSVGR